MGFRSTVIIVIYATVSLFSVTAASEENRVGPPLTPIPAPESPVDVLAAVVGTEQHVPPKFQEASALGSDTNETSPAAEVRDRPESKLMSLAEMLSDGSLSAHLTPAELKELQLLHGHLLGLKPTDERAWLVPTVYQLFTRWRSTTTTPRPTPPPPPNFIIVPTCPCPSPGGGGGGSLPPVPPPPPLHPHPPSPPTTTTTTPTPTTNSTSTARPTTTPSTTTTPPPDPTTTPPPPPTTSSPPPETTTTPPPTTTTPPPPTTAAPPTPCPPSHTKPPKPHKPNKPEWLHDFEMDEEIEIPRLPGLNLPSLFLPG